MGGEESGNCRRLLEEKIGGRKDRLRNGEEEKIGDSHSHQLPHGLACSLDERGHEHHPAERSRRRV